MPTCQAPSSDHGNALDMCDDLLCLPSKTVTTNADDTALASTQVAVSSSHAQESLPSDRLLNIESSEGTASTKKSDVSCASEASPDFLSATPLFKMSGSAPGSNSDEKTVEDQLLAVAVLQEALQNNEVPDAMPASVPSNIKTCQVAGLSSSMSPSGEPNNVLVTNASGSLLPGVQVIPLTSVDRPTAGTMPTTAAQEIISITVTARAIPIAVAQRTIPTTLTPGITSNAMVSGNTTADNVLNTNTTGLTVANLAHVDTVTPLGKSEGELRRNRLNAVTPENKLNMATPGNGPTDCGHLRPLYELGSEAERGPFLDSLLAFMQKRGSPVTSTPAIAKQPVDLFKLYCCVKERGGMSEVSLC